MDQCNAPELARQRRLAYALRHPSRLVRSHDEAMALSWFAAWFDRVEYEHGGPVWSATLVAVTATGVPPIRHALDRVVEDDIDRELATIARWRPGGARPTAKCTIVKLSGRGT